MAEGVWGGEGGSGGAVHLCTPCVASGCPGLCRSACEMLCCIATKAFLRLFVDVATGARAVQPLHGALYAPRAPPNTLADRRGYLHAACSVQRRFEGVSAAAQHARACAPLTPTRNCVACPRARFGRHRGRLVRPAPLGAANEAGMADAEWEKDLQFTSMFLDRKVAACWHKPRTGATLQLAGTPHAPRTLVRTLVIELPPRIGAFHLCTRAPPCAPQHLARVFSARGGLARSHSSAGGDQGRERAVSGGAPGGAPSHQRLPLAPSPPQTGRPCRGAQARPVALAGPALCAASRADATPACSAPA